MLNGHIVQVTKGLQSQRLKIEGLGANGTLYSLNTTPTILQNLPKPLRHMQICFFQDNCLTGLPAFPNVQEGVSFLDWNMPQYVGIKLYK